MRSIYVRGITQVKREIAEQSLGVASTGRRKADGTPGRMAIGIGSVVFAIGNISDDSTRKGRAKINNP